jgi:hypothetical protein
VAVTNGGVVRDCGCSSSELGRLSNQTLLDQSFVDSALAVLGPMFRSFLASLSLVLISSVALRAQPNELSLQQSTLQSLLNNAITAIRNNDNATACQIRSQALGILKKNFDAFSAAYPTNNWSALQASLQGSVNACAGNGN